MRQAGSIRAEAELRGVSRSTVARERARARPVGSVEQGPAAVELVGPPATPDQARQCHFLATVLRLSPGTIAGHVGLTEDAVVRALATDAPAVRV
jgi:hypothetical protein